MWKCCSTLFTQYWIRQNQNKSDHNIFSIRDIWREVADQSKSLGRQRGREKCIKVWAEQSGKWKAGSARKLLWRKSKILLLMQNPLFKCTKNVSNLSLTSPWKEGPSKLQNKKELSLQDKVENISATNQWYVGHDKELTS